MDKVKCINNHWFDAEQYSCCPHCGAAKMSENRETASWENAFETDEKPKKKGLFWSKSKNKNKTENKEREIGETGKVTAEAEGKNGYSLGYSVKHSTTPDPKEIPINPINISMQQFPQTDVLIPPSYENRGSAEINTVTSDTAYEEHKKVEPFSEKAQSPKGLEDIKTISIYANEQGEEPVTGWLVGISGEYRGNSFRLKTGVNIIGREAKADVCLKKDAQVSRACHAKIVYEPKKKVFFLGEGENSLTYCNDELVSGKVVLNAYDLIEIGSGKYMFVPFCGERFDWEQDNVSKEK